ncbi:hypothetical protein ACJRO7_030425 [Eucalyptus globulus]|uniref:Uncharacterized protein n=1 Tax=Eucalyptus globulus TaxID=34317 RepID=A0ABD3JBK3_EUCGL
MTTIDAGLSPTTASRRIKIVVVRPGSNGRRKKTSYAINELPGMTALAARTARFLHSWSRGGELCMLAQLRGHQDAVTGAGLPSGSGVLFSGSRDGTVRSWDCGTGACVRVFQVGREVGSLVTEGSGVFVWRWSEKEKEKEKESLSS